MGFTAAAPVVGLAETQDQRDLASAIDSALDGTWSEDDLSAFLAGKQDADPTRVSGALRELGLVSVPVDESAGGLGLGWLDLASGLERLGHRLAPTNALETLTATELLRATAEEPAAAAALGAHLNDAYSAVLVTPSSPWGVAASLEVTSATPDMVTLDGEVSFVPARASSLLLPLARPDGPALALVDAGAVGATLSSLEALDVLRPVSRLTLDQAPARLVAVGPTVAHAVARGAAAAVLVLACEQVGVAERCLTGAVAHAHERVQFGKQIGSYQAVRHRCAEMLVQVELARSATRKLAAVLDDQSAGTDDLAVPVGVARVRASKALAEASRSYLQILGAMGFTWEVDAHLCFRKAGATAVLLGSTTAHRRALARRLGLLRGGDRS
jgi:alkylation response protein AidB-like acyl-CoA dehydrogenase